MTEKRAESIMIPEEANYQRTMKCDVEPYLRSYEKDGYIESYDKTAIYYRTYRIPQAKAAIVISHGFCEFAEKYKEVIYYFLKNGYSVYIPEHRGHGYSDRIVVDGEKVHIEDYEQYVQDLHFFVKNVVELTEKRRILFCHSMGGAIGVRYLEEFPLTFDAAILSAPMLGMNTGKYPKWLAKVTADFFCVIGKGTKYAAGQSGFSDKPSFETSSCISRERYMYIYNMRLRNINYQTYGGTYAWVKAGFKVIRKLRKRKKRKGRSCR